MVSSDMPGRPQQQPQKRTIKYTVQVVADNSGVWVGSGLRFESVQNAVTYARNLEARWRLVRDWRIIDEDEIVITNRDNAGAGER